MKISTRPLSLADITPEKLSAFSKERGEPEWVLKLRLQAFDQFSRLSWPTKKDERWKRTQWDRIKWDALQISLSPPVMAESAGALESLSGGIESLESANGSTPIRYLWDYSHGYFFDIPETMRDSVEWIPLEAAVKTQSERVQAAWNAAVESAKTNKFLSLTLALGNGGSCLVVPKGQVVKAPFQSFAYNQSDGLARFPLHFVFVDEAAEAHVWEQLLGEEESGSKKTAGLVSSFTSITLKENAKANCYFLQHWDENTMHLQFQDISQGAFSRYSAIAVSLGSGVSHNETTIHLRGQGAENKVLGVLFGDRDQNFVNWITQNHTAPRTTSDIQYRGALGDSAHSFFSGMVYINKDAQRSDAYQGAKFLLLSKDARADAIPNLEILADDVKCSHGAAVGPVDEEQKFYLQTRGVPPVEAEKIIIQGFIEPVISEVPSQAVQDKLRSFVEKKISKS